MDIIALSIAVAAVLTGTVFSIIAVMGYIRLPDVYTRLHTTGKVAVFGVVCLLVAAAVLTPTSWGYALVLIFFLLVAGPATAHAMGSASHRIGLPRKGYRRDDLADRAVRGK